MAGNSIFLSEAQLVVADPCAEIQQWHVDSATGRGCFQLATLWWHGFFIFPLECLDGTYTPTKTSKRKVNQFVLLVTACYQSCSRKSGGLSIFIPLQDIALDRGPQEVLPGTHSLHDAWLSAIRFRRTLKLTNFNCFLDNFVELQETWSKDPRHNLRERWRRCLRSLCASHGGVTSCTTGRVVWSAGDALVMDSGTLHRGFGMGFLWWGILGIIWPQMFHEFVDFWYKMIRW